MLDGSKVTSLLNIPPDVRILIASDKPHFMGVEFEDVKLTELKEKVPLHDIVSKKTVKYSNTEIKPDQPPLSFTKNGNRLQAKNLGGYFLKKPVGVKNQRILEQMNKFVLKSHDQSPPNSLNQRTEMKLPQILNLR